MKRLLVIMAAGLVNSCGVVGAPVAPEMIGVAPTIERQKRQPEAIKPQRRDAAAEAPRQDAATDAEPEDSDPATLGQDEDLPPLRPVGTR